MRQYNDHQKGITMKCPKCGYLRQTRDNAFTPATECPACGLVYAKHEHRNPASAGIGATSLPHLKPSPVDAASLKKARERVEQRLRRQLELKVRDRRHEETLKLARRFTEEEVRKRQESWKKERAAKEAQPDPPETETGESTGGPADASPVDRSKPASPAPVSPDKAPDTNPSAPPETGADMQPGDTDGAAPQDEPEKPVDVHIETIILESADIVSDDRAGKSPDGEAPEAAAPPEEPREMEPAAFLSTRRPKSPRGGGMMRLLPTIAWLILGSGVIGAILSWTTISDAQAGVNIPIPNSLSTLPLGLLLGFAYLATGTLGFGFFWVSSLINSHLRDIRRLLMVRPPAGSTPGRAALPDEVDC
jgi:predicted  nucleic acid-binding Zn-ribbon protein